MFNHDWDETLSEERIRAELTNSKGEPFDFRGPGWYMGKDVLLVVENQYSPGFFDLYVWNEPDFDPRDRMTAIATMTNHSLAEPAKKD